MKTFFIAILLLVLITAAVSADGIKKVEQPQGIPSFLGYVPDKLIVVLKPDIGKLNMYMTASAVMHIGNPEFDKVSDWFAASKIEKQFAGAKPGPSSKTAELARYYKVKFEAGTLKDAMEAYRRLSIVEKVEPIGIHAMYATPNDTYFSPYQKYHNQANDHDIDSPEAWDVETGNTSIILAILDSGTRYYHPDLGGVNASSTNPEASRGNMWINWAEKNGTAGVDDDGNGYIDDWIGYDFIDGVSNCWTGEDCTTKDNDPRDFNGHGTHTAGITAMMTNDGYGMAGVAGGWGNGSQQETGNGIKVMPLRMGYSYNYLGQEYGVVEMDAAAEAFYYAADNGARIASCSWGSSNTGGLGAAVDYFLNAGGLIFVAAGNDGTQTADYLNGRGDCISVAAVDTLDAAASFTNYGTWVDISAPGVDIYSTYHDHTDPATVYWAAMSGTSMATPMAAAVGALIWSHNTSWTASQVENQLYSSADNIDAYLGSQYIGMMGAGRINSYNAVNTGTPAPVAGFTGSPTSGCAPLTVNFTDQSTGSITSWSWDFGDGGTSTAQNPSHTYNSTGTYTVALTVTGPGGSDTDTKTNYITVNPAPTADFVGSPTSGTEPLTVNFTDQSTGSPTSWSWDFGDGGTSTAQNPSHTYNTAGTYTVAMTATNSCGSDTKTRVDYITVNTCLAPVAGFVGSPTSGTAPLTVSFTDQSTNSPTSWSWDFGDGGSSTAQNPSHTYNSAGTYTVTLTATNACGSDSDTKTNYITVNSPSSNYATLPYSTGFESGSFDQYWFTQSSNSEGRIQITSANSPRGSYHMTMDDNTNGSLYAQNEAWLKVDLAGKTNVDLDFWWKEFSDESHAEDGVFFSDDGGNNFTKVYDLTGGTSTYTQISLDVDQLASNAGLSLTGTFVIKFQQYDNYGITTDGMAFDDISVTSNEAPPVAAFTGSPTSGTVPLTVNFTDQSTNNPTSWSWDFGDGGTSTAQNPSHTYNTEGTYTVALTATNAFGSDTETKTNYITVNAASSDYAALPYSTGFETGSFDQYWFTQSSNSEGRIQITSANSPRGSYHLTMDDNTNGGLYSQNEAWLKVDLAGKTNVELSFWWKEYNDESHTQDGVFFSDDGGNTFTKVYDLFDGTSTYTQITLDVDQLASSAGLSLTGTFVIKFQQYDNYGITSDGMAFDDIEVKEVSASSGYATLPYSTGFESGSFDQYWFTQSSNSEGRIQITSANSPRGTYHLTMDDNTNGSLYAQNEAWLKVDLAGKTNVDLVFWWKEFSDETHTQDGVFFSDDGGASFTKVYDLSGGTSTYTQISLDVDQLASSAGLSLTGTFVIKFQQYDNYGITIDGMAFDDISVTGTGTSGLAKNNSLIPEEFSLSQNYPNPFNPTTEISFALPEASYVTLDIYNILGQHVNTLFDGTAQAGITTVTWDATSFSGNRVASGVYFYRINAEGYEIITKKMLLLK